MDFHEITTLFPMMSDVQFQELAQDIARHGQIEPIWTYNDSIIDGRHRFRVCVLLDKTPVYREWNGEGGSLTAFVISKNLHRRQLTASQRATIAVKAKKMLEDEVMEGLKKKASVAGRKGGKTAGNGRKKGSSRGCGKNTETPTRTRRDSRKEAAVMTGSNEKYVSDAERLSEQSPELFDQVAAGEVNLPEAMRQIDEPKPKPKPSPKPPTQVKLTMSLDPTQAAPQIASHFKGESLTLLVRLLTEISGS